MADVFEVLRRRRRFKMRNRTTWLLVGVFVALLGILPCFLVVNAWPKAGADDRVVAVVSVLLLFGVLAFLLVLLVKERKV